MLRICAVVALVLLFVSAAFAAKDPLDGAWSIDANNRVSRQYSSTAVVNMDLVVSTVNTTGWGYLSITSNGAFTDSQQHYSAGFLEGYATWESIWANWLTQAWATNMSVDNIPQALQNFTQENFQWMQKQINSAPPTNAYWYNMALILQHVQGLTDGYNAGAPADKQFALLHMMLLNMDGDLEELLPALFLAPRAPWEEMSYEEFKMYRMKHSHCSGLIKVTPDFSDLFITHATWSGFSYMLRFYKIYNFSLSNDAQAEATVISFSSYPGTIISIDDYYQTSAGLVVIETTNGILNASLYDLITPRSVLSWARTAIANRLSGDSLTWTNTFAMYNSGTYNNAWMVVDYGVFTPKKPLQNNTVRYLEQIPGLVMQADITSYVAKGYWSSYNLPFFPFIYDISGFLSMYENTSDTDWAYTMAPRAMIFRRDNYNATTYSGMQWLIRYNEWQTDPLSGGNACNSICCRADLVNPGAQPFGCIDAKLTGYDLMANMTTLIISGPTHETQKPFSWSEFPHAPHPGQPEVFDFPWGSVSPSTGLVFDV